MNVAKIEQSYKGFISILYRELIILDKWLVIQEIGGVGSR